MAPARYAIPQATLVEWSNGGGPNLQSFADKETSQGAATEAEPGRVPKLCVLEQLLARTSDPVAGD